MRCCLQCVLPYSHTSRVQTSWPCATNPIPPAAQIFLPIKRMAGANSNEHTFPLCACFFLHPKRLLSLLNAAASQNARDAVAVSRTDLHTLLFVNVLETTVPIHSKMIHGLMTRKRMMMLLVHKNYVTFYARILLTEMYIERHNRKKTNSLCVVIMGLTKFNVIFVRQGNLPNPECRTQNGRMSVSYIS